MKPSEVPVIILRLGREVRRILFVPRWNSPEMNPIRWKSIFDDPSLYSVSDDWFPSVSPVSLTYLLVVPQGRALIIIYLFIYLFIEKQQNVKQNFICSFDWRSKRLENRLVVPASFLVRTTSWPSNRPDRIFRMKDLCTHVDIVVDRLRRRSLFFCREA